jgi:hypothetical protein
MEKGGAIRRVIARCETRCNWELGSDKDGAKDPRFILDVKIPPNFQARGLVAVTLKLFCGLQFLPSQALGRCDLLSGGG